MKSLLDTPVFIIFVLDEETTEVKTIQKGINIAAVDSPHEGSEGILVRISSQTLLGWSLDLPIPLLPSLWVESRSGA